MKAIPLLGASLLRATLLAAGLSFAGLTCARADTQDPPRHKHHHHEEEEEEFHGPAKVFQKVGGFFQRLADHIERSDAPHIYFPPPPPYPPPPPAVRFYYHRDGTPEPPPELSSNYTTEGPKPLPKNPTTERSPIPPDNAQPDIGSGAPPVNTPSQPNPPPNNTAPHQPAPSLGKLPSDNHSTPDTAGKNSTPAPIPAATPVNKPGRVKSPYPPYHELDVTGLASGSLAKDPSNGKVFRVP